MRANKPALHHSLETLLPVDLKEAWSDQIKDVEANGMPDKTGGSSKPYIFMGARDGGKGHGKLKLRSAINADMQTKILWRFAKAGTQKPEAGSSTYEEQGKVVRMTLDTPADGEDKDYVVVVGFDKDGDGKLTEAEVIFTPQTMHDPTSNGIYDPEKMPLTFKIVGKARYDGSLKDLLKLARGNLITSTTPNAANLLESFCLKKKPLGAVSENVKIERDEDGLTHPVGIAFSPIVKPGKSITAVYGETHSLTKVFVNSTQFWNWLNARLVEKTDEVKDHFYGLPLNETEHTFYWDFGNGDVNFNGSLDFDAWMSLGRTRINSISVIAKVHRGQLTLEKLEVSGIATDLYDFDYDGLGFTIPSFLGWGGARVESALGAEIQAGYPTLGNGGRVYMQRIEMKKNRVIPIAVFRWEPPL